MSKVIKAEEVLKELPAPKRGRPITTGNGVCKDSKPTKFQTWLKSIGIDKKQMMKEFEEAQEFPDLIETMKKRYLAVQTFDKLLAATKDFYNDADKRALALTTELMEVDVTIKEHQLKMKELNPEYSPVNDKQLLQWKKLKKELIESVRKQQLELTRLTLDKASKDDSFSAKIDWDV